MVKASIAVSAVLLAFFMNLFEVWSCVKKEVDDGSIIPSGWLFIMILSFDMRVV